MHAWGMQSPVSQSLAAQTPAGPKDAEQQPDQHDGRPPVAAQFEQ